MNVIEELDRSEALLWTILTRFETLAAEQYARCAPSLLTPEKERVIALLRTRVQGGDDLAGTPLATPVAALMESVTSVAEAHVLIAQGLFLELIGEAIYRTFGANAATSESTRVLCEQGAAASGRARAIVSELLRSRVGTGDVLLQAIMNEAGSLLRSLDDLGEAIDATYLDRFDVSFADLMGDVAAELISLCLELGVDRRKFVAFLTSALMGM
jgi:class 3 adenylate cyclase